MGNQWKQGTVQVWKTMFQNVSYLGFDPPHQNLQWVQYAWGFMELKGKTAWQGTLLAPGTVSPSGSPSPLYLIRVHASSAIPALLTLLSGRVLLTMQSGRVILSTWHHFDHLLKQTKTPKQQKCMLAAACLSQGSDKTSTILDALNVGHTREHMEMEGVFFSQNKTCPWKLTHSD